MSSNSNFNVVTEKAPCCFICGKTSVSKGGLSTHKLDNHDGNRMRVEPLKCLWCGVAIQSRGNLSKHIIRCKGAAGIASPWKCPHCDQECATTKEISTHSRSCLKWERDTSGHEKTLMEFDKELLGITRHAATARLSYELFEPAELRLENGGRAFALLLNSGSCQLEEGIAAFVRPLKRRRSHAVEDIALELALKAHPFGRLVDVADFEETGADEAIWTMGFRGNGEVISRTLAGLMIQSQEKVLLCLKTEAYGRLPSEDAHRQDIALPTRAPFCVENAWHDGAHKVLIGTLSWNALVTMSVILTSGEVVVGPDNDSFHPHTGSHVWLRKSNGRGMSNNLERHTRSKFDVSSTFESNAATDTLFNYVKTVPVTLKTLWEYKIHSSWTGIKLAAFIFHSLYTERKLVKVEVESSLGKTVSSSGGTCEVVGIVAELVQVMGNEETVPVSADVNRVLTKLAAKAQGEISSLNKDKVAKAVEKRISNILEQDES